MEYSSGKSYIHCISIDDTKGTFYLRIPLVTTANIIYTSLGSNDEIGREAAFIGSTFNFFGIYRAYQSYSVGSMRSYETHKPIYSKNFFENSYAIWPTFSDNDPSNCINYS